MTDIGYRIACVLMAIALAAMLAAGWHTMRENMRECQAEGHSAMYCYQLLYGR